MSPYRSRSLVTRRRNHICTHPKSGSNSHPGPGAPGPGWLNTLDPVVIHWIQGFGHANRTIGMQSLSMLRAYKVHRVTLVYGPRQAIHLLRYLLLEPTAGSLGLSGIQGRLFSMVSLPHALDNTTPHTLTTPILSPLIPHPPEVELTCMELSCLQPVLLLCSRIRCDLCLRPSDAILAVYCYLLLCLDYR